MQAQKNLCLHRAWRLSVVFLMNHLDIKTQAQIFSLLVQVDRQSATMWTSIRRIIQLINAFEKKIENRAHAAALNFIHHNFGCIRKTLRVTLNMATGVADDLWTAEGAAAFFKTRHHQMIAFSEPPSVTAWLENAHGHFTAGGMDIRIASTFPPVFRPKIVPRSCSRLNST
jgi:hypothetical protein